MMRYGIPKLDLLVRRRRHALNPPAKPMGANISRRLRSWSKRNLLVSALVLAVVFYAARRIQDGDGRSEIGIIIAIVQRPRIVLAAKSQTFPYCVRRKPPFRLAIRL